MKKLIAFCCIVLLMYNSLKTFSQRYLTEVFTSVSVQSDVVYGENYSVLR